VTSNSLIVMQRFHLLLGDTFYFTLGPAAGPAGMEITD